MAARGVTARLSARTYACDKEVRMRKTSKRKLTLHRESLHGLELRSGRGGVTNVDCTFRIGCSVNPPCTVSGNPDCTQVITTCTA